MTRLSCHEIVRLRALELEALQFIQLNCCCERRSPKGFCTLYDAEIDPLQVQEDAKAGTEDHEGYGSSNEAFQD